MMKKMMLMMGVLTLMMSSCRQESVVETPPPTTDPVEKPEEPTPTPDPEPGQQPVALKQRKDISLTEAEALMTAESTDFAFRFFRQVNTSEQETPNWMVSPLSASLALGMVTNGAGGNTLEEMKATLGFSDSSLDGMNAYYQKMTKALLDLDNSTELGIANSIWIKEGFDAKEAFIDVNRQMYDALVKHLDFSLPSAKDSINGWCDEKTKGRIKEVLDKVHPDARMYLLNALYFKGTWEHKFLKASTKSEKFNNADDTYAYIKMMNQTSYFPYQANEHFSLAELPFGNEAFSMMLLLPAEGKNLDESLNALNATTWKEWMGKMSKGTYMKLKLPRFKTRYSKSLIADMKALGMHDAFSEKQADFTAMSSDSLFIGLLKQFTYINVDEEGAEATAVTIAGMTDGMPNPQKPTPIDFHVNRPFAYIIKEKSTGTILFMGKVTELK